MAMLRVVAVAFVMSILAVGSSWGETAYDRQGDVISHGSELSEGVLDRVILEEDVVQGLIINDIIYHVDDATKATTANGRSTSITSFESGTNLEFYALDGLLTKVMPSLNTEINDTDNDPVITPPTTGSGSVPVQMEDGVWKN